MPYVFNPLTGRLDFTNPGSSFDPHSPGPIGDVTPSTGAFTSITSAPGNDESGLSITAGSITGSGTTPFLSVAGEWDTTGSPAAIQVDVTAGAFGSDASLIDLRSGGVSRFAVDINGALRHSLVTSGDVVLGGSVIATGTLETASEVIGNNFFASGDVVVEGSVLCAGYAEIAGYLTVVGNVTMNNAAIEGEFLLKNNVLLSAVGTGVLTLLDSTYVSFDRLQFGGETSDYPSMQRSGAAMVVRLADDSADAGLRAASLHLSDLPTSDPGDPGVVWNDGGTLKISI
jgi:hypothetical protein